MTQPQSLPPLPDWPPAPKIVNRNKPTKLSSYIIDPTAAYENKPDWESARLDIDVVKESPDVSPLLKSVVGGLSAVLRHYNVRYVYFTQPFIPLTFELAKDGDLGNNKIVDTPG